MMRHPARQVWAVLRLTLGQLLAGRRLVLLVLLVWLPLVVPALFVGHNDPATFTRDLVRRLVLLVLLPVVAFVTSTATLGTEVRDGTITNLVLKPIPRSVLLVAKYAAALAAALAVLWPAEVAAHLVAARGAGSGALLQATLLSTAIGAVAYCAVGVLLSLFIPRALLVGLAWALLWEGAVVSAAPSASSLSVRGYAEGVLAAALRPAGLAFPTRLGPVSAVVLALLVTTLAIALAVRRLERMDFR